MALTTTTALSYYQVESSTISEWPNPITFSLEALSADDIEVCVIDTSTSGGSFPVYRVAKKLLEPNLSEDFTMNFPGGGSLTLKKSERPYTEPNAINANYDADINDFIGDIVNIINGDVTDAETGEDLGLSLGYTNVSNPTPIPDWSAKLATDGGGEVAGVIDLTYYGTETTPLTVPLPLEIRVSAEASPQKLVLTKGVDYNIDFNAKTVTCTSAAWSDLSKITGHSADRLRVHRTTTSNALVDFTNGAVLNDTDLNLAYKQNLFAAQEMNEDAALTRGNAQSVGPAQIADLAVTNAKIANTAVNQNQLADDAVSTAKIQASAVNASRLATDAVETAKIQNNAVDENKLATDAVTTVKIANEAVTYDKVLPASKAQMEGQLGTGTHGTPGVVAGVVTPDVLKNSPLVPKCYGTVSYDNSTPSVTGGFNVQGVTQTDGTDNERTIEFTTGMAGSDYTVLVTQQFSSTSANRYPYVKSKSQNSFTIAGNNGDGGSSAYSLNFVVLGSTYYS